jgi:hypothetical protein
VIFRVTKLTRRVPTEETKVTDSNALKTARQRRTPYEWLKMIAIIRRIHPTPNEALDCRTQLWVGLRVNDKAGGAKRNIALE